jgi:hypothetical protein
MNPLLPQFSRKISALFIYFHFCCWVDGKKWPSAAEKETQSPYIHIYWFELRGRKSPSLASGGPPHNVNNLFKLNRINGRIEYGKKRLGQQSRVARFLSVQYTKTWKMYQVTKNIPNGRQIYQMKYQMTVK